MYWGIGDDFGTTPPRCVGMDYTIEIQLQDDDNGDDQIPFPPEGNDDEFQVNFTVSDSGDAISGGGWQLISIPLNSFFDDNSLQSGGNGILDTISTANGGNGQLVNVIFGQSYTKKAYLRPVVQRHLLDEIRSSARPCRLGISFRSALP